MRRALISGCALALMFAAVGRAAAPEVLAGLRADHPRILAYEEDFRRIQETVKTDAPAKRWCAALKIQGEAMLPAP